MLCHITGPFVLGCVNRGLFELLVRLRHPPAHVRAGMLLLAKGSLGYQTNGSEDRTSGLGERFSRDKRFNNGDTSETQ